MYLNYIINNFVDRHTITLTRIHKYNLKQARDYTLNLHMLILENEQQKLFFSEKILLFYYK